MKVSIIIPVYNTEKYIARCLDSILHQTHRDLEIICVNDCSPDNAMGVVTTYAEKDPRVKALGHETNRGPMVARQTGIQAASGDYYMFVDSDDTLPADAIEVLLTATKENAADIVVAGHTVVDSNGNKIKEELPFKAGEFAPEDIFTLLIEKRIRHNLAFCLFAKSLFHRDFYTLENQNNCEDMILFYELVGASKRVSLLRKSVYNYYQNPGSTTHSRISRSVLNQMIHVINFQYRFLIGRGLPESQVLDFILPHINIYYLHDGKQLLQQLDPKLQEKLNGHALRNYLPLKKWGSHLICKTMPGLARLMLNAKSLLHK